MLPGNTRQSRSLVLVALVLLFGADVSAQQAGGNTAVGQEVSTKPCIMVYGAATSPFRFELKHPVRLDEAISLAGGAAANAVDAQVIHYGPVNCFPEPKPLVLQRCIDCRSTYTPIQPFDTYKLSEAVGQNDRTNPYLQAGDLIMVIASPPVYVVGNVVSPQGIFLVPGMTLTMAIEKAGGVRRDSNKKRIRIIRLGRTKSEHTEILVNWEAIRKHRAQDLILQSYDIIEVPENRHEEHWWRPGGF